MATKSSLSRLFGSIGPIALAGALAGGCATGNSPAGPGAASASASTDERDAVVRCYANDYRKRTGVAPVLDDKTDKAAEQLLAKHHGDPKKACDALVADMAAPGGRRAHADVDTATKAQIDTGARERGMGEYRPR
ncbi:MAG TPA: hypothetical protein VIU64_15710 [Polyangia bacterium]